MTMRSRAGVAAVGLALLPVVACSGRSERRTVSATLVDGKAGFSPATVTVHTDDEVTLTVRNTTDKAHGFSIAGYGVKRVVDPGASRRVRFTAGRAGTFKVFCQLHPTHQTATLVVL